MTTTNLTQFKTIRKRLGFTQPALAHALNKAVITVKTWENPNGNFQPPASAWDYLNAQLDQHRQNVRRIMSEATKDNSHTVHLSLYRHPDEHERRVNAQTMEAGALLDYQGYRVEYFDHQ